ncbi:MAG: hypothetical protein LBU46_08475 [Candidatus Accumulibacter sp.]|nr:hypothetical protein [Accumulibacter sp.]
MTGTAFQTQAFGPIAVIQIMEISGNLRPSDTGMQAYTQFARADRADNAKESMLERNLRDLRTLNDNLKSMQAAISPKQQAANRLGYMRQRLEAMKFMLRFATPEQAKEMVRELKSMAKEMASIARSLKGGGGTQTMAFDVAMPNVGAITAGEDSAASADATAQAVKQAEATASQAAALAQEAQEEAGVAGEQTADASDKEGGTREAENGNRPAPSSASRKSDSSDKSLRTALAETAKLLKQVLTLLKPRLTDKEGKEDAAATERYLGYVQEALSQGSFYDVQGVPALVEAPVVNINVSA